ncbi:hypothetical protein D9758_004940 [Tetrapyrgos nigripes]|uniref:Uncharacterized protein n=1 Tax=Tetrapyrgos nigripes TaxID=182062 RepID=A0A8H5GVR6_9AGAR|nr:hypothetical protein D9758_004940 [Tetrapyrgos nigripes]
MSTVTISELEHPMSQLSIAHKSSKDVEPYRDIEWIRQNEPWNVYEFPEELMPWFGPEYLPPHMLLGAIVTVQDLVKYARHVGQLQVTDADLQKPYWLANIAHYLAKQCRLEEYHGNCVEGRCLSLLDIWTKGPKKYMLTVCSNYTYGDEFPITQCELLLAELKKAGIKTKLRWCLSSQWYTEKIWRRRRK